MNLLTLSLVTALHGEKTERQPGGEKGYHDEKKKLENILPNFYKH